jgi:O-antigen/teichoic acid export membrane protein
VSELEAVSDDSPRRILNTLTAGIGSVVFVSILGAYSVRLMTTHLGATSFGIFVLVQAFVSLAWNFSDLGLSEVLQRDIARDDQDERWLLSHAMGLRVTLGILVVPVAAVIGLVVYSQRPDALKIGLILLLCSVPFAMAQEVAAAHFTARLRNTVLAIGSAVQQLIFVGLVLLAISLHRSIVFCIGAALAGSVISSLYILVAARREVNFSPAYNRATWISMLRTSSPVGLAYIVGSLYVRADTIILSFLSTVKQIGYYGVSYSILSVFLVLPIILTRTFIPSLVKASGESVESTADASLVFFAIGGTFSAAGVMVCGPTVVRIIAGTHFGPSVIPLRVLGFGLIFIFMSNGLSSICLARGATSKLFQVNAISLLINIGLNIAAIPSFGINGAAEATLLCEGFSMLFMMYVVATQAKVKPKVFQSLTRPFAAGLIACAVFAPVYLHHDLGVGIGLALVPGVCVVYFGALAAMRGIPDEIRSGLRSLRRART